MIDLIEAWHIAEDTKNGFSLVNLNNRLEILEAKVDDMQKKKFF